MAAVCLKRSLSKLQTWNVCCRINMDYMHCTGLAGYLYGVIFNTSHYFFFNREITDGAYPVHINKVKPVLTLCWGGLPPPRNFNFNKLSLHRSFSN